ncbi:DUF4192 domain-containing protein [Streptomyces alanosinicus]|uniref:DUF4192 domain-containing protein n=1 Tax=Streptomyces alanosinicus TaxID=68171 RepID=A0A918YLA5_9ACTN|nr:DUF4192 domain-containing protein [Streptomyces alanosinicus]GHE06794.1 hypothetical protein GCM10010339_49530 [Streptomyces alanosinicus]
MTNHSETTGPIENGDIPAPERRPGSPTHDTQITLRTPAELADALPYLLGYRPEDSMVLVALHDRESSGRFGGRARLGIPAHEEDWEAAAHQLAHGLVTGSRRRGAKPEQMVAYVCQEPSPGESGRDVKRRLARLAHLLRTQCGDLDVPVIEALCISDGRFWSYCCPTEGCCPDDGTPMGLPGTSVLAAAATYAGIQVRGTLRELRARMQPWETTAALKQETALDTAGMTLVARMLDAASRTEVAQETLALAERIIRRFAAAVPVTGTHPADLRDDGLLAHDEAAALILGLQDRTTRDRAAAWMEGDEAGPALRLWRALARRCVGPYGEHAAAPLTLVGWVAWSTGDELEAREALAMALGADPDYLFARLLHQACNDGLDPEAIRRCLRANRADCVDRTQRSGRADRRDRVGGSGCAPGETGAQRHAEETTAGADRSATADAPAPGAADRTDSQGAEARRGTGTRRRRRTRPASGGGAPRAARTTADRLRPAGSRPGSSTAALSRSGNRGPGGMPTRAAEMHDTTTGAAQPGRDDHEPEADR